MAPAALFRPSASASALAVVLCGRAFELRATVVAAAKEEEGQESERGRAARAKDEAIPSSTVRHAHTDTHIHLHTHIHIHTHTHTSAHATGDGAEKRKRGDRGGAAQLTILTPGLLACSHPFAVSLPSAAAVNCGTRPTRPSSSCTSEAGGTEGDEGRTRAAVTEKRVNKDTLPLPHPFAS